MSIYDIVLENINEVLDLLNKNQNECIYQRLRDIIDLISY